MQKKKITIWTYLFTYITATFISIPGFYAFLKSEYVFNTLCCIRQEQNCRAPETDSPNPWGSIEPRLRTTAFCIYAPTIPSSQVRT